MPEFFADESIWNKSIAKGCDEAGVNPEYVEVFDAIFGESSNPASGVYPATGTTAVQKVTPEIVDIRYADSNAYGAVPIHRSSAFKGAGRRTDLGDFATPKTINVAEDAYVDTGEHIQSNGHVLGVLDGANAGRGIGFYACYRASAGSPILTYDAADAMDANRWPSNINLAKGALTRLNPGATSDLDKLDSTGHWGHSGSGLSRFCVIRDGELEEGFDHAVAFVVPGIILSRQVPFDLPAWNTDATSDIGYYGNPADQAFTALSEPDKTYAQHWGNNIRLTYGARLAIPFGTDLDAVRDINGQRLLPEVRRIGEALMKYGGVIADQTAGVSDGWSIAMDYPTAMKLGVALDSGGYAPGTAYTQYAFHSYRRMIDPDRFVAGVLALIRLLKAVANNYKLLGHSTHPYGLTLADKAAYFAPANNTWRKYKYFAPDITPLVWTPVSGTPTRVDRTTFSFPGDKTTDFAGKKLKISNASYSVYGTPADLTYNAGAGNTTVTCKLPNAYLSGKLTALATAP